MKTKEYLNIRKNRAYRQPYAGSMPDFLWESTSLYGNVSLYGKYILVWKLIFIMKVHPYGKLPPYRKQFRNTQ